MNISYSQVEMYCNELHSVAKNIKEIFDNIENLRTKILNGDSWSGKASQTFCDKLGSVTKNFEEVYLELENSILYMASCSDGYEAIDKQIMQEICSNLNITEPNLNTSNIFGGK